jgi:hypothetical protein
MSDEAGHERVTLTAADAAVLDALLGQRADPSSAIRMHGTGNGEAAGANGGGEDAERRARVQGWLNVLGSSEVPAVSPGLLERTLGAVERERMKLRSAASMTPLPASHAMDKSVGGGGVRRWSQWRDVAAMFIAATLLVSVLVPAVGQARQSYRRTLCATDLAVVGKGFAQYAVAFERQLPCLATPADRNWLVPGVGGHTNTANLLPLVNASYVPATRLICAGRGLPDGATAVPTATDIRNCSYSYINMFGPVRPTWNGNAATIVLADHNPLFVDNATNNPESNSLNHGQKGTYVLRADGHVTWEITPNVGPGHDNIWTVGSGSNRLVKYSGIEVPTSNTDVFLAP